MDYQILKFGMLIKCILFMTIFNFKCTSLLHSKVVGVQSEQDNQGYKEMKGDMQWLQIRSDQKT